MVVRYLLGRTSFDDLLAALIPFSDLPKVIPHRSDAEIQLHSSGELREFPFLVMWLWEFTPVLKGMEYKIKEGSQLVPKVVEEHLDKKKMDVIIK